MIIWPDCSVKTLKECESGSIVRHASYGKTGAFAIACDVKDSENRALIYLEKEGPEFEAVSKPGEVKVLEYAAESMLQVDQAGPFEASPKNMYEANGCLLPSFEGWRMNVRRSTGFYKAQYDFSTKTLEHISDNLSIGTFGKWCLVFVNSDRPHDPPIEVGNFEWKARGEEST